MHDCDMFPGRNSRSGEHGIHVLDVFFLLNEADWRCLQQRAAVKKSFRREGFLPMLSVCRLRTEGSVAAGQLGHVNCSS